MNISLVNDAQTWGIQVDGLDSDKFKIVDFQPDPDVTVMTFVKSTGNVGIGTTVPANTLTVNSSSNRGGFEVTNATDSSRFFVNASSGNIGIGTASPFSGVGIKGLHVAAAGSAGIRLDSDATSQTLGYTLWQRTESGCAGCFFISNGDATSDYVTIDTTGNLGIGTASPGERLDVRGNMTITENLTVQRNLTVQHNLSVGGSTLYVNSAAGNVGIGTTSPGAVVHVLGGAVTPTNARFLQFGQASTTTADISAASAAQYGLDLRPTMKMTGDGTSHFGQVIEPYSIDDGSARTLTNQYGLYISAGSKGASTTITNVYGLYVEGPTTGSTKNVAAYFGGNVGIGTTSPASTIKLEVNGTIRVYKTIQVLDYYGVGSGATISTAGPQGGMNFTTDSGLESGISFSFVTSQGSAYQPAFSITANRKAAVNTLAGAAGNSLCYDTTTVSGMNTFATCSSSRRYKENIEPLSVDKDKVFQLQPVSFKWKNRNESSVGLIAEDVEPVIPELVGYYNGQIESVEYKLLTVYLLDIAKEQDKNITMLNNANMALRLAVQKLEEKNSNMEADVGLLRHEVEKLKIQSNGGE
ncbi:MAG: tail fiber domain-containing protein [Candidatus Aenigmarchaeota archaeon]|nr:tail fiber domain-containing protein [Candidatus Aenigmarchaeota archaeon]